MISGIVTLDLGLQIAGLLAHNTLLYRQFAHCRHSCVV